MNELRWVVRPRHCTDVPDYLRIEEARKALAFHKSFAFYRPTPLVHLKKIAAMLGVSGIWLKDESQRFGLSAFKVLGSSYAVAKVLAQKLDIDAGNLSFNAVVEAIKRAHMPAQTFITATDGNHGRGVAWAARQLGQKAVVYMPRGSSLQRLENIRREGADASITELNYDATVRKAAAEAEARGWTLVQDTSWPGYQQTPRWIMQGYGTMILEALSQMGVRPTHVLAQAGVGSMPGAAAGFLASMLPGEMPHFAVVESLAADCLFRTAAAGDGAIHSVSGAMKTIMAGLACGVPNPLAWSVLDIWADCFLAISDPCAARAMRVLGNPLDGDPPVRSGESGASGFGAALEMLSAAGLAELREKWGLNSDSRLLIFNTEGDTDPENYRRIVWDGAYPTASV